MFSCGSGIFGGVAAPEPGAVGLVVFSKGEFGESYCGSCISDKKNKIECASGRFVIRLLTKTIHGA